MDYFVYLSAAKVDMLFPQIPSAEITEISHKIGFDLKLLKASRETKRTINQTLIAQARAVEEHIRSTAAIGDFDSPELWVAGEIEAKLVELDKGSIAFVGSTGNSVFSLGGSSLHLGSGAPPAPSNAQASYLPDIANWIAVLDLHGPKMLLTGDLKSTHDLMSKSLGQGFAGWVNVIEQAMKRNRAPRIKLKHFSRRLAQGYDRQTEKNFILGTPLYVALAD